ncbi:hypothetical protein H6G41_21775 [Tolypothrix sp. FACHB-123]|uniref:hypothetical protein n=1 Tax=Tolypothrix sp. FACHB-123 TaxID=2692868 RepID=UPI00168419B3|nr:hypothetical protein [Tolypothrix sp. FACHB-123]MBD2357219.1 hypothetical protein [Tolypothrix sp. FACHB-123]
MPCPYSVVYLPENCCKCNRLSSLKSIECDRFSTKCDVYHQAMQYLSQISLLSQNYLIHREPQLLHNQPDEVVYQRDLIHREGDRICDQPDRVVYQ